MHWLPLVAMVIASALPFPHDPVSRITAATTEPGSNNRREQRHDPMAARTVDHNLHGTALQTDYDMAAARSQHSNGQDLQNRKDDVKSSAHEETSMLKVENHGNYQSRSNSGSDGKSSVSSDVSAEGRTHRTEDISEDYSLTKDYKADSSSSSSNFVDFSKKDTVQDSKNQMLQVPTAENHHTFNSASTPKGPKGPEPTVSPEQGPRRVPAEDGYTLEAGLGLGPGLDNFLEGGKMFLDAHPRVLFSPSLSPPEHPPLLLMLESGQLEEDGGVEEQEDMDGHIEGHGDRAIDRGWADSSRGASAVPHANKRDKRSHSIDRRRGEKSVCESESVWVTDKRNATDWNGRNVTILQEIQTQTGPLKQYFYETRCRQPEPMSNTGKSRSPPTGVAGAGCLGVDKKQWLSECKAKQSYVRALTKDANNKTGWRWIRIDSSCVCVLLSRANQASAREVLMRKGRG